MRSSLLRILAALSCLLTIACANVIPVQDFDLGKMAGKWYLVGVATNAEWFVNHKADMKMGTATMTPTGEDLDLAYASLNADGTCWRMTHLAKKTETPGRFTFRSETWNNENDLRIIDVVYDSFAIVHNIKTKDGVSDIFNKLYSRTPEISDDLQQKFVRFSLDTGVAADNIAILPRNAECPEA
ncbi:unnamed protein product [Ophioblennius macclurei]